MLSEMLGKVSDCAIIGSARVDVELIIAVGSSLDGGGRSKRSCRCPAGLFVGSQWLGSSLLSIVGRKRRIAKTLPANLDFDFQKGILGR
jgi:hypothetical protein